MKRSLLLSSLPFVACGLMAQSLMLDNGAEVVQANVVSDSKIEALSDNGTVTLVPTATFSAMNSRADVDVYPRYILPGGAYYRGFVADKDYPLTMVSGQNAIRVPAGQPLRWLNASYTYGESLDGVTYTWDYYDIDWTAMKYVPKVSNEPLLTTPAIPAGYQIPRSPMLSAGDRSFGGNCTISNVGVPYVNFSDIGRKPLSAFVFDYQMITNNDLVLNTDSIVIDHVLNCSLGTNILAPGQVVKSTGFIATKPDAPYGISGVTFHGFVTAYNSPRMQFDIYKLRAYRESNGSISYEKGERLGGGYIDKENIPVKPSVTAFTMPIMEVDGELAVESFINIDDQIIVLLSGWETIAYTDGSYSGDIVRPIMTFSADPALRNETHGVYVDGNDKIQRWSQWTVSPTLTLTDPAFGVLLYNGNLAIADATESTYEYQAPVNGGSQTFTFQPTSDLAGELVKIEGNGLFDWYDYEVGEMDANNKQTIKVNVEKLEGSAGRYALLKVSIPGAEQIIKIKQGELSGIGSVEADAEVVASEYFDMMGRKLNAEPQSGMFIRKDLKADGTTVATKLAK